MHTALRQTGRTAAQGAGLCGGTQAAHRRPAQSDAETRVTQSEEELRVQKGVGVRESASSTTGTHDGTADIKDVSAPVCKALRTQAAGNEGPRAGDEA